MRHGSLRQTQRRTNDTEQRLIDLSEEFLKADRDRREAIGEEFQAILDGSVVPLHCENDPIK